MSKVVFMFPGQGAQYIGMGKDFYDACEESKAVYELASKVTGLDIAKLCFEENEEINITDSMKNLKEFFTYRDNRKEFESIVKDNKVGVPMITDGEKIVFFEKLEDLRVFDED